MLQEILTKIFLKVVYKRRKTETAKLTIYNTKDKLKKTGITP